MAESGRGNQVVSLPEKKDAANAALPAIRTEAERANIMKHDMESAVAGKEQTEYVPQKKQTVARKMKAAAQKFLRIKPRKKGKRLSPIVGATMKYHKDDDVDPEAAEASTRTA